MILLDAFMDPRLRGNDGLYSMDDGTHSMDDMSNFYSCHPIVQRHCDNFVGSNSEAIQHLK